MSGRSRSARIVINRMPFNLSGQFKDEYGQNMLMLPNGNSPRLKIRSAPAELLSVDTYPTMYRTGGPWGDYVFDVTEYGGTTVCFVPQTFSLSVTAQDVAGSTPGNRRAYERDVTLKRQQETVRGTFRSGGQNVSGAVITIVGSNFGVPSNVGKTTTTTTAATGDNFALPAVTCDQVRLPILPTNAPAFEHVVVIAPCGVISIGVDANSGCRDFVLDY
jgi:hypothetical protein